MIRIDFEHYDIIHLPSENNMEVEFYKPNRPISCPYCGRIMVSRGNCRRKVCYIDQYTIIVLKVLYCSNCNRYHRVLPDDVIPYHFHTSDSVCDIIESKPNEFGLFRSTRTRFISWVYTLYDTYNRLFPDKPIKMEMDLNIAIETAVSALVISDPAFFRKAISTQLPSLSFVV